MKTLEEFNRIRAQIYDTTVKKVDFENGIECPQCKKELFDSCDGPLFLSDPPQRAIYCKQCGYTGYRIA